MKQPAPILLFVFARPNHTQKTLEHLAKNHLANNSDLIIYSDAARNENEIEAVEKVRSIIDATQGFRSVTVVKREVNYGLARNIIEGVSDVIKKYECTIVLEDDLVTSPNFLTFMNEALERYNEEKQVWHISGWNYPIDTEDLGDAFFTRVMNCWGWATWHDRWQHFEKNTEKIIKEFNDKDIYEFDLENSGVFWSQILLNQQKKINTWAIYWYASIFRNNGLCLNPAISYIDNIGHDGSGTHGSNSIEIYTNTTKLNTKSLMFL